MSDTIFLELEDHIGIEPDELADGSKHPNAGEPGPLVEEGCSYTVPTLVAGEVIGIARHVKIRRSDTPVGKASAIDIGEEVATDARILPGTRQIETTNPELVSVLEQGGYRRVDPPKSNQVARAKSTATVEG